MVATTFVTGALTTRHEIPRSGLVARATPNQMARASFTSVPKTGIAGCGVEIMTPLLLLTTRASSDYSAVIRLDV